MATQLSQQYEGEVGVVHLEQKGRGRALKRAWSESDADIRAYMDVDLSTDINRIPDLLGAIREGHDVATGSRLRRGAETTRSFKREFVSRSYNLMIKSVFWSSFFRRPMRLQGHQPTRGGEPATPHQGQRMVL